MKGCINMEKVLKIVDSQCNRYLKILADSKCDDQLRSYCYKCDVGDLCNLCRGFQFKGYFKELGKGI